MGTVGALRAGSLTVPGTEVRELTLNIILLLAAAVAASLVNAYLRKQKRFRDSLHRKYFLSLANLVIILICVSEAIEAYDPSLNLPTILLRSSALLVAILGFAAQPVITNLICGLLISFQKPFEIGDRIHVEGQEPGIVEDITLRHTVLRTYDNVKIIIPNGELNAKTVTNFSYGMTDRRGVHLRYAVSYDTDMPKAIEVIRDCVAESPYTLSVETNGIREDSGPVYFLDFGDSALILRTTIWISRDTNTQVAVTDMNLRVLEAFRREGIEIPYPYFNVVNMMENVKEAPAEETRQQPKAPVMRYFRTDSAQIAARESGLGKALGMAKVFAERQNLNESAAMQLELLTEESIGLFQRLMEKTKREFWIDGTGKVYRIHLRAAIHINNMENYQKLIELSSVGRNEAVNSINARIVEAFLIGRQKLLGKTRDSSDAYEWRLSKTEMTEDEIGRSILGKLANDVRICVKEDWVELSVTKRV